MKAVKDGGTYQTEYEGASFEFTAEDLLVSSESPEGFASQSENGLTVALDTALTPELIDEGNERELISKIQTMRKDAGFEVTDRIRLYVSASENLRRLLEKGNVSAAVLAEGVAFGEGGGFTRELDINGETCVVSVEKL